jgi:DNA topoisomerase-3
MASLVICEKPSQAQKIKAAVGSRYGTVLPARGHLLRLAEPEEVREEWKSWSTALLHPGQFYAKVPTKDASARKMLMDIKAAAGGVDRIVIATDCDREGQLIGQEIVEFLRFQGQVMRVMFNAEDPKSLQDAFAKMQPNANYRGLYLSGVAREQADQITNLSLTRAATVSLQAPGAKTAIGVGRVKTPVLAIVCQRELEIRNFKPQNYFEILATAEAEAGRVRLRCSSVPSALKPADDAEVDVAEDEGNDDDSLTDAGTDTMAGRIMDRAMAEAVMAAADGHRGRLAVTKKEKRQAPGKLFDLTALQATCSSRWGWSGDQTLKVAQALYSDHQILTYPRGEARYLPENNIPEVPAVLKGLLGLPAYSPHRALLAKPEVRKGKSGHFSDKQLEGLSHHAIIPNVNMADKFASIVPSLSADEARLFDLVARSYLAALAPDYRYLQTVISMPVPALKADWMFSSIGNVAIDMGWRAISGRSSEDPEDFPPIANGDLASLSEPAIEAKETKPPGRYNEGSLAKAMQEAWRFVADPELKAKLKEAKGIGTPATRSSIITGLLQQGQLAKKAKMLIPTEAGMQIYSLIARTMPEVVNPGRTAQWETLFSSVERGGRKPEDVVRLISDETGRCIAKLVEAVSSGKIKIATGKLAKPSEKVIAWAKKISAEKGIALPDAVVKDAMAMRLWLDQHAPKREAGAGGVYAPSEKQVNFARSLAERSGQSIPDEALADAKKLSAWIDATQSKAPPAPPSEKQLALAERLAAQKGVELTSEQKKSGKACSAFIDKHMGGSNRPRGASREARA